MGKPTADQKFKKKNKAFSQNESDLTHHHHHPLDSKDAERFDVSKPIFRSSRGGHHPTNHHKVVLDERFAQVLTDPRFQLDLRDKYGRRTAKKGPATTNRQAQELSVFYTLATTDRTEDEFVDKKKKKTKPKDGKLPKEKAHDKEPESDDVDPKVVEDDENDQDASESQRRGKVEENTSMDPTSRIAYLTALSRGELDLSSSSDDDDNDDDEGALVASDDPQDDDDEEEGDEDPVMGTPGILDSAYRREQMEGPLEMTTEESPYLAVMNLDWAHIRAVDIWALVSSFVSPGAVRSVHVYPSDFGRQRLAQEEKLGPTDLWKKKKSSKQPPPSSSNPPPNQSSSSRSGDGVTTEEEEKEEEEDDDEYQYAGADPDPVVGGEDTGESDFDPEKLRAYEASKLRYFFAVVTLASPAEADQAYRHLDGAEFEHSSAALDVRSIPAEDLSTILQGRPLRDQATSIPSNYLPPEFIVQALQQSKVQCTWEEGDRDRERKLTHYSSGKSWAEMAESDDLKAYLASDQSSDDDEDVDDNQEDGPQGKGASMRRLLGLDSEEEGDNDDNSDGDNVGTEEVAESEEEEVDDDGDGVDDLSNHQNDDEEEGDGAKEVTFVPGGASLEDKIRAKLKAKTEPEELTPWQKYQEKRKQKRRERRQATREKRKEVNEQRLSNADRKNGDNFFLEDDREGDDNDHGERDSVEQQSRKQNLAELELLVAGEDIDEDDYDMRGLVRMEKNKDKKLRGSRKRKEEALASSVAGTDFKVNLQDDRFRAVLDGDDDRFGIDKNDPNFRETPAMKQILQEQTQRRKNKRKKKGDGIQQSASPKPVPDVQADAVEQSSGSMALSALVKSIKAKISNSHSHRQ